MLVPSLIARALAEVADVLPGAVSLEVLGETNEDSASTSSGSRESGTPGGEVLYDIETAATPTEPSRIASPTSGLSTSTSCTTCLRQYFGEHVLNV